MPRPFAALAEAIQREELPPLNASTLEELRDHVRRVRDQEIEARDLKERVAALEKDITLAKTKTLPDLFDELGLDHIGLEPEGNLPAYDAKKSPYHHANIAADWSIERRETAFNRLESDGHGDLIKHEIKVLLGRGEEETAEAVRLALVELGVSFTDDRTVPWNTLTAFVREQIKEGNPVPLDLYGATVGTVVKLTERKT